MVRLVAGVIVTTLLMLSLLAAFLLDTTSGARFLAREAQLLSGGTLEIGGVSGTLAGGLRIATLHVEAGTTGIQARDLTLELRPLALLGGRVVIGTLGAAHIDLRTGSTADPTTDSWQMPTVSTPLAIDVRRLDVGTLEWRRDEAVVAVLADLHLAANMHGSTFTVREFRGRSGDPAPALSWRLAGTAGLGPDLPLDLRLQWRHDGLQISGAGMLKGNLRELRVEQLLELPDPVRLTATLRELNGTVRFETEASWAHVDAVLPGLGSLRATDGRLAAQGTVDDWKATLGTVLHAERLETMRLDATARGDLGHMIIEGLALAGTAGKLVAQGEADFPPVAQLRLDLDLADFDTRVVRAGLDGRLSAQARITAQPTGEFSLTVAKLEGRLMGRPLAGAGEVSYESDVLRLRNVKLRAGENRLTANGTLGAQFSGRFDLDAPDLAVLWPGLSGRLAARAALEGTPSRLLIDVDAHGGDLVLDENRLQSIELQLHVGRDQQVDAQLTARGLQADGRDFGTLDLRLGGRVAAHDVRLQLHGGLIEAMLASTGGWDGRTLRHKIGTASLGTAALGVWQMQNTLELRLSADAADIGAHCWVQEPATLCVEALAWSPQRSRLAMHLRDFDLQRLAAWFPDDLAMAGQAEAEATLELTPGGLLGSVAWRQDGTMIRYTGGDEPLETVLEQAHAVALFSAQEMRATLDLAGPQGVALSASARLGLPALAASPFEARFSGTLPDIAALQPFLAADQDFSDVAGRIVFDVAVDGSLQEPQFSGAARLSDGAVALTDAGIRIEDIEIALLGDGGPVLRVQGLASAGGRLSLAGELRPFDEHGPGGKLRMRGNNIDVVRLPDRFVRASPDLTLSYADGALTLDGEVSIPKADIVVRELPESAVSPSRDTVFMDREIQDERATTQTVGGEIAVNLGRDVRLRGFGLDTRLAGTLKLSQADDGTARAFGVVRLVDGRFGAYGKELVIERGTLGFTGPLDDPAVDLRAVRQVDWEGRRVTAGVLLRGTASRPQSRIFSEPAMAEADALSYLVSGRPLQSTGASDQSAIAGAALALGVQQTSPLTARIGSAISLDELGLQGGSLDETEIVAGKQIAGDLYVRFSYGLFNRIGTVLARYRLGHNISIEAASGEDQSLDLIYSVERP